MSSKPNFSDPAFINKLITQDHHAIELLIKTYTSHLFNAAKGMGLEDTQATELVQNTWETFFEIINRFEKKSHIRTFVFGIFYNKAKEYKRELGRINQNEPIDELLESQFNQRGHWPGQTHLMEPEKFAQASQTINIIEKCLSLLPVNQKMAFHLKEIECLQSKEICNILGITNTNLGVLLYRAKGALRKCIENKAR